LIEDKEKSHPYAAILVLSRLGCVGLLKGQERAVPLFALDLGHEAFRHIGETYICPPPANIANLDLHTEDVGQ
jgi:hypothetical protein